MNIFLKSIRKWFNYFAGRYDLIYLGRFLKAWQNFAVWGIFSEYGMVLMAIFNDRILGYFFHKQIS